jgi:chromosome segregation ATPase
MALTATAVQWAGRQDQAGPLALVPALGADAEQADLQHQISVKTIAAKMLNERIRKLVAEAAAKDKRLAELDDGLRLTREDLAQRDQDLAQRDNQTRSLQASLDLVTAENASLSARVNERAVDAEVLSAQLQNSKTALLAAEAERDQSAVALREGNDLHRIEFDELRSRLEAAAARTAAVEMLLMDVRKSLQACSEESDAAARKAVDATLAKDAAEEALGRLYGSLQVKEDLVCELERSRAMLIVGVGTLLEAFAARVAALAEAEERTQALAGRIAEAEANSALAHGQIDGLNLKLQGQQAALDEAAETLQSLAMRAAAAEADSSVAQDKIQSLTLKSQCQQAGLDEAAETIHALTTRAAAAEADSSVAQDKIASLNLKLRNQQADLDEAAEMIGSLIRRATAAEANASAAQDKIQNLKLKLRNEEASGGAAEGDLRQAQSDRGQLRRESDNIVQHDEMLIVQHDETRPEPASMPASLHAATSLLAATISF